MATMVPTESFSKDHLRAPTEHGQVLIHPNLSTAENALTQYQAQNPGGNQPLWLGKPWSEIVATARHELYTKALSYSSAYPLGNCPISVAGIVPAPHVNGSGSEGR